MAKSMADILKEQAKRDGTIEVADLPAELPVLVGHMVLEYLDLCLDIKIKKDSSIIPPTMMNGLKTNSKHNMSTRKQRK